MGLSRHKQDGRSANLEFFQTDTARGYISRPIILANDQYGNTHAAIFAGNRMELPKLR